MTSIPHQFMVIEAEREIGCTLPGPGKYAVSNLFFHPKDESERESHKSIFAKLTQDLSLRVLGWREIPTDGSILGPASSSKEPTILQPFLVLGQNYGDGKTSQNGPFDARVFERQLYVLRKHATHTMLTLIWHAGQVALRRFALHLRHRLQGPALSPSLQLLPQPQPCLVQVALALVHSRFSTNTSPSWNCAQPMRWAAHNGETNTVRGNRNWMHTREGVLRSTHFSDEWNLLYPIIKNGGSDLAACNNVLKLLVVNGVVPSRSRRDDDPRGVT
ncbi:glutamate synthase [NADH] [Ceratobasidium sp. UAMH 11750]|nr:glutamate synthase [NADH] [Ceratobasidium sp. UAMH 11750]